MPCRDSPGPPLVRRTAEADRHLERPARERQHLGEVLVVELARGIVAAVDVGEFAFARALDRLFGILPGLVRGALIAALVVIPFSILPFFPRLTEVVQQSRIGSRLLREVMVLAPAVEARLGASFDAITPPPGPGEPVELPVRNPLGPRSDAAGEQEMFRLLS